MVFDLGRHTGVLGEMVSGNQIIDRIMAAHCLSASCANSVRPLGWLPTYGIRYGMRNLCSSLRMRFGVPTVLPIGGWRCDCRARGRLVVNGAVDFERREDMQRGDVMHGVSLQGEAGTDHPEARCGSRFACKHAECIGRSYCCSTARTLEGEGGRGQRGDTKLLANGTQIVIDVTVACPATRHMPRTHHAGTVPGAAGGYAQACKRRK